MNLHVWFNQAEWKKQMGTNVCTCIQTKRHTDTHNRLASSFTRSLFHSFISHILTLSSSLFLVSSALFVLFINLDRSDVSQVCKYCL